MFWLVFIGFIVSFYLGIKYEQHAENERYALFFEKMMEEVEKYNKENKIDGGNDNG